MECRWIEITSVKSSAERLKVTSAERLKVTSAERLKVTSAERLKVTYDGETLSHRELRLICPVLLITRVLEDCVGKKGVI